MNKPAPVLLLTILALLAGLLAGVGTLRFLGLLTINQLGPVVFPETRLLGAVLLGILSVTWFWVAAGLWRLDPNAWIFVVVITAAQILFDLAALLAGASLRSVLLSFILDGAVLVVAFIPGVRVYFKGSRPG